MVGIVESLRRAETLTFDCYGTLIDWRAGLTASLVRMFGDQCASQMEETLAAYFALEAEVQTEPFRTYREVLTEVTGRLSDRFGWTPPRQGPGMLADLLPTWPPFPDTVATLRRLKQRFRLGVLSNIDRDLFAGTAVLLRDDRAAYGSAGKSQTDANDASSTRTQPAKDGGMLPFDFLVTAEDVRAYKPDHAHFARCFSTHAPSDRVVHVAQSLFHDGVPAQQLGFAFVWINRYNDTNDTTAEPLAEFGDLRAFADFALSKDIAT